jgi:hypothetical protein
LYGYTPEDKKPAYDSIEASVWNVNRAVYCGDKKGEIDALVKSDFVDDKWR